VGLAALVARAGFEVVEAFAGDGLLESGLDDVDVLVIDLGDDEALRAALELDLADVPAVVLAERPGAMDPDLAARAWLDPQASEDALAAAIAAVAAGLTVYSSELGPPAADGGSRPVGGGEVTSITEREHDVLVLLAAGLPNKAIALQLGISEHTVKFHVGSLLSKLEAQSRTEAVTIAARQGLLTL
jgi:DNA-binding NarL/FixJ family response regulator